MFKILPFHTTFMKIKKIDKSIKNRHDSQHLHYEHISPKKRTQLTTHDDINM